MEKVLGLRIGVVPSVNGKPSWNNSDENVIVDSYPNINNGNKYDYRVVYKVWSKDEKEENTQSKEVSQI